ncbi:MAG: Asp-tRNA(Asn)/Glu-tRNA(Gln) amidotransferase GatCAB subunit A [Candidatus Tagabacteria bacterium CG_4_9_14_0_2_um_filter_41_11]|uniref:Glutamyl-tRNA(Gln) amidotransferase subunit A n=2 Tax=Candidatus Tagaibacteriota TaxID=1817918 RepID=A0A2M8G8J9_9BACT|nr:MAG: Asp-tRNA(Asn)/Glu-tRNA(Gln) amidotransferase GatCAB subunit A [Candidatus Tagabacteria bacterium CG_4_9_14_0_2_um_filter_41_11]PJC69705.1 MAG: Asp-tRNA(Asn)/Glu-tRNA(Gln) amidotransferase GatCAB subunit A [Candidatus Tagabacteria bacterium CG_4_8_14_3_um_filter_41_8]
MTKINLSELTIKKAHDLIHDKEISCRELLSIYQENIKKHEKNVHAYLEVFDDAFEKAEEEDKKIMAGEEPKLLAGIPLAIKNNIMIKGKICSAGSKILENYKATYDATVIKKLRDEGAIFIGRTNMDEFAMGSSTENSAFGPTKNPYDLERVPGGSSGGSAAAVVQQECLAALGSDTGGSIRQPAAFCGIVGLKPTYGAVSRYGLIAMASSLDQIGPLAKTTEDIELLFNAIKGKDSFDSTSIDFDKFRNKKSTAKIIGVPKEFFSLKDGGKEGLDKDIAANIVKTIDFFKDNGYIIKEVSLPYAEYSLPTYYILMPAEVSANLARFDGIRYGFSEKGDNLLEDYMKTRREGFGKEARRRIILGTYVLSEGYYDAYYSEAQKIRDLIKKDFENAFKEVDVLITPATPTLPFKFGEKSGDPLAMYLSDIFTVPANLAGIPAVSVPMGFIDRDNVKLPTGIQFIGPWFGEEILFDLSKKIEYARANIY